MRLTFQVGSCRSLLFLLVAVTACAEPSAPAGAAATSTPDVRASSRVVEAVRAATTRAPGRTERVAAPGGGQVDRVVLGEGYRSVAVGRLEPDGTVTTACVDNAAQAESFLAGGTSRNTQ